MVQSVLFLTFKELVCNRGEKSDEILGCVRQEEPHVCVEAHVCPVWPLGLSVQLRLVGSSHPRSMGASLEEKGQEHG